MKQSKSAKESNRSKHSQASKKSSQRKRKMDYDEDPHEESQYLNLENEIVDVHERPGGDSDDELDQQIFGTSKKGSRKHQGSRQIRERQYGDEVDDWEDN